MIVRFTAIALSVLTLLAACSDKGMETLPAKPADVAAAKAFVKGKKFSTEKTGFFGNLTINDKTEMEWIDIKTEKEKYAKDAAETQKYFALQFINDTSVTVFKKDTSFTAAYAIDNEAGEYDEEKQGIKLRLSYADPEFSFEGMQTSLVTYTYIMLGAEKDKLLLQLPQSVNRRKLVSLLLVK